MNSRFSVIKRICVIVISTALFSCSSANSDAPGAAVNGTHPANWLVGHRAAYREALKHNQAAECRGCHGTDLTNGEGGITRTNCTTTCHAGAHVPRLASHPLPFTDPLLHGAAAKANLIGCQACHGTAGGSGSNPRFNLPIGLLAAGCESSGCHAAKTAHPTPKDSRAKSWLTHKTAENQPNDCALCHGAFFSGGNGPSCAKCHKKLVAGQLPQVNNCISCHSFPPDGAVAPDITGSHAAHTALPEVLKNCMICHIGGGTGTKPHYDNASSSIISSANVTVGLQSTYKAQSGTAAYNSSSRTCANVKCHGGLQTPVWGSALHITICTDCHSAGGQFNSYVSGQHLLHVSTYARQCAECHDMVKMIKHFSNFSTSTFSAVPSGTLQNTINYNTITKTCAPNGSSAACHAGLSSITQSW
ncbi:MAG: CxxxxCH/CxxCH domain c-type cytochrome [Desulfuromonadaceae bacterium]